MASPDAPKGMAARFKGKGNRLFLYGMVALLVIRILLYLYESNQPPPQRAEPGTAEIKGKLQPDSPVVQSVHQLTRRLPVFADSPYIYIAKSNPFDPKRMLQQAELNKKASEKYSEALSAVAQSRLEDARRALEDALTYQPDHQAAQKLYQQVRKALGLTTTNTAATTATATVSPAANPPGAAVSVPPAGAGAAPAANR